MQIMQGDAMQRHTLNSDLGLDPAQEVERKEKKEKRFNCT
jgi:hypothetical protein